MARTPEGNVKYAINKVLDSYRNDGNLYYYMPVPYGYGTTTVDYLGCVCSRAFAIEAKAPGKRPGLRQNRALNVIQQAGGKIFVIDGTDRTNTVEELNNWLAMVVASYDRE